MGQAVSVNRKKTNSVMKQAQNTITIYVSGDGFGSVSKIEGKLIDSGFTKYAQYDNAPFVDFIPAGKRKPRRILKSYNPYLVVLKGTGYPEPPPMFTAGVTDEQGTTVRKSVYSSFDARWQTDADIIIDKVVKENPDAVILDVRSSKTTVNSYN